MQQCPQQERLLLRDAIQTGSLKGFKLALFEALIEKPEQLNTVLETGSPEYSTGRNVASNDELFSLEHLEPIGLLNPLLYAYRKGEHATLKKIYEEGKNFLYPIDKLFPELCIFTYQPLSATMVKNDSGPELLRLARKMQNTAAIKYFTECLRHEEDDENEDNMVCALLCLIEQERNTSFDEETAQKIKHGISAAIKPFLNKKAYNALGLERKHEIHRHLIQALSTPINNLMSNNTQLEHAIIVQTLKTHGKEVYSNRAILTLMWAAKNNYLPAAPVPRDIAIEIGKHMINAELK